MSLHTERIRQIRTRTLLSTTCTARSTRIQLQVSMRRTRNCVASEPESESIFPPTFTSPALQPSYRGTTRQRMRPSVVCESRAGLPARRTYEFKTGLPKHHIYHLNSPSSPYFLDDSSWR